MSFETTAALVGNQYGKSLYDAKKKAYVFHPLGNAVFVEEVMESLETDEVQLVLSFDYQGKDKFMTINREELADSSLLRPLARLGADVTKKNFDTLVDTIRLQEHSMHTNGSGVTTTFGHLGWISLPSTNGVQNGTDYWYRSQELLGSLDGKYVGNFDVSSFGSYEAWKAMVEEHVVGHSILELVLIASLASIPNGLLAEKISAENPIVHLNYASSGGKTTAAILATSPFGKAFDGVERRYDEYGQPVFQHSLLQSWGATDNALVHSLAGNRGVVTVLNEFGKYTGKSPVRTLFDFSEGTDKKRLNSKLGTMVSERFSTVFISTGETSLLEACNSKLEGLQVRVMEINEPVTDSAEHSRAIKEACLENCGWAAPMLAEYIMDNGGPDYVHMLYKKWQTKMEHALPDSYNKERFVEKFAALFMATAEMATEALGIAFDMDGLQEYLVRYDQENGPKRNSSAESYEKVIEECQIHRVNFYTRRNKHMSTVEDSLIRECWGRVTSTHYKLPDGRLVVEEFEVLPSVLEDILLKYKFGNLSTCIKAWKKDGVLDCEVGHSSQRRTIVPGSMGRETVYVFRVFGDPNEVQEREEAKKKKLKKKSTPVRCKNLLKDDGDDE